MKAELKAVANELRAACKIFVASHSSPEGDALGSSLGLSLALKALGKDVHLYNADPIPNNLRFLPQKEILTSRFPSGQIDVGVICDVTEPERVAENLLAEVKPGRWLVVDHHRTERDFGDVRCNDPAAPATSELVLQLIDELGVELTKDMAVCLYTGLAVDTGNFRFSNATERAFEAARRCAAAGANASHVAHDLFEEQPISKMRLTGRALDSLEVLMDGRVGLIVLSDQVLRECGATPQELDGLVNYPRALAGCRVAAQLFVQDGGAVRVSLRTSYDAVDVEKVARSFGGGGHQHAAGCTIEGPVDEARRRLIEAIGDMLKQVGM